jgi:anti-anti-sigma factor
MHNNISFESKLDALWIFIPDSITQNSSSSIETIISEHFSSQVGRVVFDFSKVNNIYSTGLGLLIRIRKFVHEKGGVLCIVNISQRLIAMFLTMNLDKVFLLYATDVEYEISQNDVWMSRRAELSMDFLFVAQLEGESYRLNISGQMVTGQDLSALVNLLLIPTVRTYIIDLSSLDLVDSFGVAEFIKVVSRICASGANCKIYGASNLVYEAILLFEVNSKIEFYKDEKSAVGHF